MRSGPAPNPLSGRSDRFGLNFRELPTEGYSGKPPSFPLEKPTKRELTLWRDVWKLPQGHIWSQPGHEWRHGIVAMYVRQFVRCESEDVGAAHVAQLHRFADQIGLTDAGLAGMGWTAARSAPRSVDPPAQTGQRSSRDRITVVAPVDDQPKAGDVG
ncbi:hypothetical protein [Nocardioides massiliensis]|uniref:hypothetical protein n=1 Tax=Nocardioides massiliensis TaxID=1325935 RepID=UPI00082CB2DE|nr:hypothetical protein [Nocardioides massiliensis]